MPNYQTLLSQAAVIRDATTEKENTALRVGGLLVSLVQALEVATPDESIDFSSVGFLATSTAATLSFDLVSPDGTSRHMSVPLPTVTASQAGVATPSMLSNISSLQSSLQTLSDALDTLTQTKGSAGIIDTFRDVEAFLAGFSDSESETLKRLLDSKADGATVNASLSTLQQTTRNLDTYCNNLSTAVNNINNTNYKSVRQLYKIVFDDSVAVSVEQGSTDLGGVVEYYASCGFVLKASDGKYYADWSNRWWYYGDSGQVRTDVLYLYDNRLWHWTGTTLIDLIGKSIADQDSERLLLMAGKYGGRTADGAVTLNGVTLSADDMVRVMALGYWEPTRKTNGLSVRTNLPPIDSGGYASPDMYAALVNSTIEVLNVRTQTADGLYVSALRYAFSGCSALREIQGEIKVSGVTSFDRTFAGCSALEEVRLTGVAADVSLADSPLLSWDSFAHLVSNAKGSSPVTVTLHPTAYDRITGDDRYDNIYSIIFNKQITVGKP